MKTATLTFHGSHNYGSMLQSYALQKVMIRVFGENDYKFPLSKAEKNDEGNYNAPSSRAYIKGHNSFVFL